MASFKNRFLYLFHQDFDVLKAMYYTTLRNKKQIQAHILFLLLHNQLLNLVST